MHFKLLASVGLAVLMLAAPAQAAQERHEMKAGCCDMPCCADHKMPAASVATEADAMAVLTAAHGAPPR